MRYALCALLILLAACTADSDNADPARAYPCDVKASVFLSKPLSLRDRRKIEAELDSLAGLKSYEYFSSARALSEFEAAFPDEDFGGSAFAEDSLPASYRVELGSVPESRFVSRFDTLPGVDEVRTSGLLDPRFGSTAKLTALCKSVAPDDS